MTSISTGDEIPKFTAGWDYIVDQMNSKGSRGLSILKKEVVQENLQKPKKSGPTQSFGFWLIAFKGSINFFIYTFS